jgi:peptide chain release factor 2
MSDDIRPEDLKFESWPPVAKGGQHVGLTSYGLRVEHIPTGLTVIVEAGRSQHRNRLIAIDMLLGGLTSPHAKNIFRQ